MPFIDKDLLLKDISESVVFSVRDAKTSPELRGARKIIHRIENAPTADVVEVVHGEWIAINSDFGTPAGITMNGVTGYKCSLCGRQEISKEPYCNCGAKMDGRRDT